MYDSFIHAYEKLPLATAGIIMGLVLILVHAVALTKPKATLDTLRTMADSPLAGQTLLTVDFLWIALLLYDSSSNPLRMCLFDYEFFRNILLLASPVIWFVLATMVKEHLFARALGLFLLLMALVPLTAAYLKDPATRLLIPTWWYPVLTIAMFWVAKPYLFRKEAEALGRRPRLFMGINIFGAAYGAAVLLCAILFW